jgi:hypothetical protein
VIVVVAHAIFFHIQARVQILNEFVKLINDRFSSTIPMEMKNKCLMSMRTYDDAIRALFKE